MFVPVECKWSSPDNEIQYRNAASPFLVKATIKYLLSQFASTRTIRKLETDLYVDDRLTGSDSEEEIMKKMIEDETVMKRDSLIVLNWTKGNTSRWKEFVQNREQEIRQHTSPERWEFCPGKENTIEQFEKEITDLMRDLHIGDIPPDCPGAGQSLLLWVQSHVQRSDRLSRRADQPSLRDDPEYQALLDNFGPSRATPGDSLKLILRERGKTRLGPSRGAKLSGSARTSKLGIRQAQKKQNKDVKLGILVLLRKEGKPRLKWPLGVVTKTHVGKDGLTTTVEIKTGKGKITRALHKLHKLKLFDNKKPTESNATEVKDKVRLSVH
ncbi:hypothetical protein RRG08_004485 [Elysia crispata]|uniref:DUF5641 domain-containing protein n=1 Tax=Elysia crispata TaxID=231223 RepID=A0AAE1BAD2_9GAST|nr:hypothetical protein RRG08_004485 [Elysia crispata]